MRQTGSIARRGLAIVAALLAASLAPAAAASNLNFTYYCVDGQNTGYFLRLGQGTLLEVQQQNTQNIHRGSYSYTPGRVSLSVPALGFNEQSVFADVRRDFMIAFNTPSVQCNLIGHARGPAVQGYARCPSIKYIPSISYESNAFEFYPERGVKRRRWTELVSANDTLYKESFGIYLIEGDRLYMAFGWNDEEKILTGQIYADQSFTINELEPGRGPCKPE